MNLFIEKYSEIGFLEEADYYDLLTIDAERYEKMEGLHFDLLKIVPKFDEYRKHIFGRLLIIVILLYQRDTSIKIYQKFLRLEKLGKDRKFGKFREGGRQ